MARSSAGSRLLAYAAGKALPAAVGLISVPILLRSFGASEYGIYAQSWVLAVAVSGLGVGWLRQAELRFTGDASRTLRVMPLWFTTLMVLATGAVASATSLAWNRKMGEPGILLSTWGLTSMLSWYSLRLVLAQRDMNVGSFNGAEIVRAIAGPVLALGFGRLLSPSAWVISLGLALGYLFSSLLLPAIRDRHTHHDKSVGPIGDFLRYGWPLTVWLAVSMAMLYADRFVLESHVSPEVLGRYAALSDLMVRGMTILGAPLILHVHPVFMKQVNAGNVGPAMRYMQRWAILGGAVLILGALAAGLLSPVLLPLLGVAPLGLPVLIGLAIGGASWQFSQLAQKRLEAEASTVTMLIALIAALIAEAIALFCTVPRYGVAGAAWSMALGPILYAIYCAMRLFAWREGRA